MISQKGFIPYEDGKEKKYHVLSRKLQNMLDSRKPFTENQREEAGSLTMLKKLAELPPEERKHPWSGNFNEGNWWWWGENDSESSSSSDDEPAPTNNKRGKRRQRKKRRTLG